MLNILLKYQKCEFWDPDFLITYSVMGLSDHISSMDEMRQKLVYTRFIHPFLSQHRYSGIYLDMAICLM